MELRAGQLGGLCALALLCVGLVMVNSADMMVQPVESGAQQVIAPTLWTIFTGRAAIYMLLAVIAMIMGALMPVRLIARWVRERWSREGGSVLVALGIVTFLLLAFCALVYVPGIADVRNGAHRWIGLGAGKSGGGAGGVGELSMQPSEVAKWMLIPIVAWYCTVRSGVGSGRIGGSGLIAVLIAVGAVAGFVVVEDLGTGVLLGAAAGVILLCAGAKWWHFAVPGVLAAALVVAAITTSEYRMNRLKAFVDPYSHPETIGFHTIQGLVAIHNGRGVGLGLGEGIQKRGYLPEDRTDYIFAVICEELGVAGAAAVMAMFIGLVWAGYGVARREQDPFLRLWGIGITATVGLQASLNLLVVTGLVPAKGIALPMVSYGGTGWIMTAFSIGVLMAIDRTQGRMLMRSGEEGGVVAEEARVDLARAGA